MNDTCTKKTQNVTITNIGNNNYTRINSAHNLLYMYLFLTTLHEKRVRETPNATSPVLKLELVKPSRLYAKKQGPLGFGLLQNLSKDFPKI